MTGFERLGSTALLLWLSAVPVYAQVDLSCTLSETKAAQISLYDKADGNSIGSLAGRTKVFGLTVEQLDNEEVWVRLGIVPTDLSNNELYEGFVFSDYLECDDKIETVEKGESPVCTVNDPTDTPLNVRSEPGGALVGTLENKAVVRPHEIVRRKGKIWAKVEAYIDDNPIGWVRETDLDLCDELKQD